MANLHATVILLCAHMFHLDICQTISENPPCSCDAYGGCRFNSRFSPDGTKENVALGKPATASSYWTSTQLACTVVNGNTSNTYIEGSSHPNCHQSGLGDNGPWWEVDLSQVYTIHNVTIFIRDSEPRHMLNTTITVDNQECFKILDVPSYVHTKRDIQCMKPLRGQKLRLSRFGTTYIFLNICEVQVWVCKAGLYGPTCTENCSEHCKIGSTCDNYDGTCLEDCSPGWYGAQCTNTCSNNCQDGCERSSGLCTGWSRLHEGGCLSDQFGPNCEFNCSSNCSRALDVKVCDIDNGTCLQGCEKGFHGSYCEKLCSVTCAPSKDNFSECDLQTGKCLNSCWMGFYGEYCEEVCGHCESAPCHHLTGICLDGCAAGYQGSMCNIRNFPTTWELIIVLASFGLFILGVPIAIRCRQKCAMRNKHIRHPSS